MALQNSSFLQVTAHESFGINQTMAILVRVAPIAYVMINRCVALATDKESVV